MKYPNPSFSVNVDVTNPGQFFACCGLLELSHRLWPGAEGWFKNNTFHITSANGSNSIAKIVSFLNAVRIYSDDPSVDDKTCPLRLRNADDAVALSDCLSLRLDWWLDSQEKKTPLKLWSGQQTSLKILQDLKEAFCRLQLNPLVHMFDAGQLMTGRFGVDPRAAWNALDVGFSPNSQQMKVTTFPSVEFLAGIGLQGFRPVRDKTGLRYATWSLPLAAPVARAAATGVLPAGEVLQYRFQISDRGSYKGFDYATLISEQEVKHE